MPDQVTLLYEDQGRPLARHRLAFPLAEYAGAFTFDEVHVPAFHRTMPVARLVDPQGADVVPPLHDAKLLWMKAGVARITGIEVDELSRRRTVQTWNVRLQGYDMAAHIDIPPL